jgi:uracil-DNA glycosylase family 4
VTDRIDAREAARLLRQRVEMGEHELFLEGLTREQALALARAARAGAREGSGAGQAPRDRAPTRPTPPPAEAPARAARPAAPPPAPEKAKPLPVLPASYEELRAEALACTRCRLSETRTQVVFSDGAVDARLVVVGEAPGANEDETGLPFVGAAGKYLDLLLGTVGLSRQESVYICNVLKCRPPGNRNPMPDEIEACSPFLKKQLEIIRPQALLAVGSFAAQALTGDEKSSLGKLRGTVHAYEGVPLVVTYHPAALLRNPKWTRAFWDDLQLLRTLLDRA